MIDPSTYEDLFQKGVQIATENFGDADMANFFIQKFVDTTFVDTECLDKAITAFKQRNFADVRFNVHSLKGRLRFFNKKY